MKKSGRLSTHRLKIAAFLFAGLAVVFLLLVRLNSLTPGLSPLEHQTSLMAVGWHGIYHSPLFLPIQLVRSVVFKLAPSHGIFLTRAPNVFFGLLAIIYFFVLIHLWHGRRIAVLATALLTTSAWTLHVSRYASNDVIYLLAGIALVANHALLYRYGHKAITWYHNLFVWGLLLTIPGLVWLVLLDIFLDRHLIAQGWRHFKTGWQRLLSLITLVLFVPLLIVDLRRPGQLKYWLGLPKHLTVTHFLKQLVAVPVHILIRGPQYPTLWLGKAPLLDVFSLALAILGVYYYALRLKSSRSKLLLILFIPSWLLVALGGPVSLSLVVGLTYVVMATGLAYLLYSWYKVFPLNPIARSLGLVLISLAVVFSCLYNLRAYFVAWPGASTTKAAFSVKD